MRGERGSYQAAAGRRQRAGGRGQEAEGSRGQKGAGDRTKIEFAAMRLSVPILAVLVALAAPQPAPYDLLIKNGRIVDGTGSPWFRGDVAIRGDSIARIAAAIDEPATRVIDVHGNVVAPGFI